MSRLSFQLYDQGRPHLEGDVEPRLQGGEWVSQREASQLLQREEPEGTKAWMESMLSVLKE
jgi:hypothetical protein